MRSLLLGGVSFLPLFNAANEGAGGGADDPPAADGAAAAAGAETDGEVDAGADGETAAAATLPVAATPAEDWRDREIRRKHAQLQESKRREAEKDAELAALRAIAERVNPPAAGDAPPAPTPAAKAEITDEVRQQAIAQVRFDEAANSADKSGKERYGDDWKRATDNLALKGGFDVETMNGILATDDPAKVLYELGKDPDKFDELMALPPHRRLAAFVKMGIPAPAPKGGAPKPSNAPPPPNPIGGRQQVADNTLRDDLDDDTWYARRQAQKKARHEAKSAAR